MDSEESFAISVIMPVFRAEMTLGRALKSLESQDIDAPFEVLFAYDEGGDGSRAILEKELAKHPSYRLVEGKERLGVGRGRLEAIRRSKGRYIAFLDSDDLLAPYGLRTLFEAATKESADLVNASFYVLEEKGEPKRYPLAKKGVLDSPKEGLEAFFMDSYFRAFLWTKLIKRELFFEGPLLSLSERGDMFEDTALLGSLLPRAKKIALLSDPVYSYDKGVPSSATSMPRKDRTEKHLMAFAYLRAFYEATNDAPSLLAFAAAGLRSRLSFSYDASLDKKNGASPLYLWAMKKEAHAIFDLTRETPLTRKAREELPRRIVCLKD